jgi:hypothetical protein
MELGGGFRTQSFGWRRRPEADVVIVIKHAPGLDWMEAVSGRAAVIYCPVDFYGSAGAIDADGAMLRRCSRIVVHCEQLRRYFEAYSLVEFMDHHVKFASPLRGTFQRDGYVLWVGVRSNLPALVDWINRHGLPAELRVLTNPKEPGSLLRPGDVGFRHTEGVKIEEWSPEAQVRLTAGARAVLDVKGGDFRSRHKPAAKAMDFLASGVPLAMNQDSSPVEHLARMGFEVASPFDRERWFSRDYWEETRRFGGAVRELLSRERIGQRFKRIIEEVIEERSGAQATCNHKGVDRRDGEPHFFGR